jgi:hypothetical protein
MPAPKGTRPPAAGKGRPKGAPNKITADVKAMILGALTAKGGQAYLEQQAEKNPIAFMTLLGKVLPMQIAGDPTEPLQITWINYSDADPTKG